MHQHRWWIILNERLPDRILLMGEVRLQVFFRQGYSAPAYMMTKKEIVDGGVKIGELYAGKDVLPFVLFLFKTGLFLWF